jgi:hypothetical protein
VHERNQSQKQIIPTRIVFTKVKNECALREKVGLGEESLNENPISRDIIHRPLTKGSVHSTGAHMTESHLQPVAVDRSLAAHGAIMTLIGLLSGFTPLFAKAPVAALEAHTIGVVQGALLFGLAAIWPALGTGRVVTAARYCALIGLYANWLGAQLSGIWSAKGMFIVNGASMPAGATAWMEGVVAVLLNLSVLVIVMCLLILWALRAARMKTA